MRQDFSPSAGAFLIFSTSDCSPSRPDTFTPNSPISVLIPPNSLPPDPGFLSVRDSFSSEKDLTRPSCSYRTTCDPRGGLRSIPATARGETSLGLGL